MTATTFGAGGRYAVRLRRFVLIGTCFLLSGLLGVIWNLFALVLTNMEQTLGWSRLESSAGFSLFALAHALSTPLIGVLLTRFDSRLVMAGLTASLALGLALTATANSLPLFYLCFGVLAGIGTQAFGSYFIFTLLSNKIRRRSVTAMAIADAGAGVGLFAGLPLINLLLQSSGWPSTFLVLAVLALVAGLLGHLLVLPKLRLAPRPAVPRAASRPGGASLLLGASMLLGAAALQGLQSQQVALFGALGAPESVAVLIVSAGGLAMFAWRLGAGHLSDRFGPRLTMLIAALGATATFATVLGFWGGAPIGWLALYPLAFAAGFGAQGIIFTAQARTMFEPLAFIRSLSIIRLCAGLGLFAGPLLAGGAFELGGYGATLGAVAVLTLLHLLVFLRAAPPGKQRLERFAESGR